MTRNFIFSLAALFSLCSIHATAQELRVQAPVDEVARVDQLIRASEESLERLKKIRALLIDYKQAELVAVKNPTDTNNLTKLVDTAKKLNTLIDETGVQDYFAPQFLEELKKLAQVSNVKNIPPAK